MKRVNQKETLKQLELRYQKINSLRSRLIGEKERIEVEKLILEQKKIEIRDILTKMKKN